MKAKIIKGPATFARGGLNFEFFYWLMVPRSGTVTPIKPKITSCAHANLRVASPLIIFASRIIPYVLSIVNDLSSHVFDSTTVYLHHVIVPNIFICTICKICSSKKTAIGFRVIQNHIFEHSNSSNFGVRRWRFWLRFLSFLENVLYDISP